MCKTVKSKMNRLFVILLCCGVLVSCRTSKNIAYLQQEVDGKNQSDMFADMKFRPIPKVHNSDPVQRNKIDFGDGKGYPGIKILPKDILSIVVISSTKPELALNFNLPLHSYQAGSTSTSSSYSQRLLGYLVDVDGYIDFPGFEEKVKVSGMTREQLSSMIKQRIIDDGQIKDPIVNVEFMNFKITVLGEVRTPGVYNIQDDKITIFDALGRAGDLTLYGKRDNVLVMRERNGEILQYRVDLRSSSIINSPVFYLQQNDVVYITPNSTVAARSRINENRTLGVGISMMSLFANIVNIYYTISLKK